MYLFILDIICITTYNYEQWLKYLIEVVPYDTTWRVKNVRPTRILAKQKEVSPEVLKEVKRKQEERELAKQDFFERLKKSVGSTAKQETKVYSGERKLMGIATMHKSNAVPVFEDDKKLAKDIAKMRR